MRILSSANFGGFRSPWLPAIPALKAEKKYENLEARQIAAIPRQRGLIAI